MIKPNAILEINLKNLEYNYKKLSKIANELSLNIVDTKSIDFLRSLPSISSLVEIAPTWNLNKGLEVQKLEGFKLEFKNQEKRSYL